MEVNRITLALPKGKLFKPCVRLLRRVGLPWEGLLEDTRQMVFDYENKVPGGHATRYIVCRPTDIPTFVEYGAADLGIAGKDTIVEDNKNVFELVDLKFGYCRFVVALPEKELGEKAAPDFNQARIATKFPNVAKNFFKEKGVQVEIVKLHGNIELAPMVGLADMIVDIVSTGRTLKENNLIAVEEIFSATARLIANRASFRIKAGIIQPLQEKMREVVEKEDLELDENPDQS